MGNTVMYANYMFFIYYKWKCNCSNCPVGDDNCIVKILITPSNEFSYPWGLR